MRRRWSRNLKKTRASSIAEAPIEPRLTIPCNHASSKLYMSPGSYGKAFPTFAFRPQYF